MLEEKIQNIRLAMFKVRSLREKRDRAAQSFRCVRQPGDGFVVVDDISGGAHVVDAGMPMCCSNYDAKDVCRNFGCPNHDWNKRYVDLLERLRDARRDRNMAILNLFCIKNK